MEDYQIHTTSSVETDYEVQEINFEGQIDSREVVIDLEALEQCDEDNTLVVSSSVITTTTHQSDAHKRRYSFVWQYFHPVSSNQFECILCQSIVGNQTSNLSRHLDTAHGINNQREELEGQEQQQVHTRSSRSFIWKYCSREDSKHARCHLCKKVLYCGGGNTTNITKHLRRVHTDLIKENGALDMDEETMQATASLDQSPYDEEDHNGRSSADISSERKERRGASYVWSYCEKLSRHTIRCKLCQKVMSFHGTANVITHLQRRHNVLGEPGSQISSKIETIHTHNNIVNNDNYENGDNSMRKFPRKSLSSASVVWKYCTRISSDQVRCSFCKKNLSYQGTSNLQRHLHRMHGVVTHGRLNKPAEEYETVREDHFKLPRNTDFIWQFLTQIDDNPPRSKCNMCECIFDTKDTETIVKHLAMTHSVETNVGGNDGDTEGKTLMRTRKRTRQAADFEHSDEGNIDDYYNDTKWTKMDESEAQQMAAEFDEGTIKKDESLYDELIEEDHNNYDEEPFDPSLVQDMPQANPLSPQSSTNNSPEHQHQQQQHQQTVTYQATNCPVSIPNLLPPLDVKVLQKLQEDRLRMETEYFREKAGYYRMQKYLTALQAKKTRFELERLSHAEEATVVTAADLNGAYAVEVSLPEHHITTQ